MDEFNSAYNPWIFEKVEPSPEGSPRSTTRFGFLPKPSPQGIGDNPCFLAASSTLKPLIQRVLRKPLSLSRINTNLQFPGQEATFHTDGGANLWTCVLFTSYEWKTDWGGELIIRDENSSYLGIPYLPNTAVVFRASLPHRGSAPNFLCPTVRKSLAFTYEEVPYCRRCGPGVQ
jgi:hypothetical protein